MESLIPQFVERAADRVSLYKQYIAAEFGSAEPFCFSSHFNIEKSDSTVSCIVLIHQRETATVYFPEMNRIR